MINAIKQIKLLKLAKTKKKRNINFHYRSRERQTLKMFIFTQKLPIIVTIV